ncbi:hypothetical protein FNF28_02647 [Cafeteria roenbergensis]|uniref:UBL3-like ubiquitin domain-containing protein n=1 Tax=Cafeteria roenbergensis TaxID=33653 RepID=A0A5A8DW05_CAFRO|nr:hypothetical protein FNF28_02647 [Cafeteria roenbergensis]
MPDRVLVRFANISAAPLDLAVSPDMTVGQLKEIVWGGWPEAKTKEAESEVPYAKLRITGHGARGVSEGLAGAGRHECVRDQGVCCPDNP